MASTSIVFDILARDRASDKFDRLGDSAKRSDSKMGKFAGVMGKVGRAGGLVGVALGGVAAVGIKLADSAMQDAAAADLLRGALERNANATPGQVAAVEEWISAQGRAKGVADDDLRPALGRLVTATKDVHKAQDLASLAMDVSAATGKDLGTVSTALMKAENGRTDGLARLGINTKNAKGETIGMREAVKRMGEQFGGAATEKANTLSGKMDRLKLMLSETGEEIGYKLLPIATDLADWFLAEGVPAIQKMSDKFKEWWPTIKKVGGIIGDILVIGGKFSGWLIKTLGPAVKLAAENLVKSVKAWAAIFTWFWNNVGQPVISTFLKGLASVMDMFAKMVGAMSKVPGFGWLKPLASDMQSAADKTRNLADNIKKIPNRTVRVDVIVNTSAITKAQHQIDALGGVHGRGIFKGGRGGGAGGAFSSGTSIFGTDLSVEEGQAPKTISAILAAGAAAQARAQQVAADVTTLIGKGLSNSLLKQLQEAGEAGAEQIHLLAGGTAAEIASANAADAATRAALKAAGLAVGEELSGVNDPRKPSGKFTLDDKMANAVKRGMEGSTWVLKIDGRQLRATLERDARLSGTR